MSQTPDVAMQDASPPGSNSNSSTNASTTSKALPAGIIPANKASTAATQDVIDRYAPGSAPHWIGIGSTAKDGAAATEKPKSTSTTPRNLPVKRYDGEPLSRADLQHAVLCYLFDDTRRVFTNPRPGPRGPLKSTTWRCPVPTYAQGMAKTCARASDETEKELNDWKKRMEALDKAPFVPPSDDDPVYAVDGAEKEGELSAEAASSLRSLPPLLRQKEGYPAAGTDMLTFKELYIEALLHSGKCTKAMRDKMLLDEEFAEDFAKVCLLVNVGRINTTLAFYPEMKTILRSYHPLPSLQRNENSRRHLQDAPRMKSLLKAVLLDGEKPGLPGSGTATGALAAKNAKSGAEGEMEEAPGDFSDLVRRHLRTPSKPPTSVVTVIFLLNTHSSEVSALHFDNPHDYYTLFFPHPDVAVPSRERGRVFLWLMWHYLEGGMQLPPGSRSNPYDDEFSRESVKEARKAYDQLSDEDLEKVKAQGYWKGKKNPSYAAYKKSKANARSDDEHLSEPSPPEYLHRIMAPKLHAIDNATSYGENADTREEKEWGVRMKEERRKFLIRFQEEEQAKIQQESVGGGAGEGEGDGKGAQATKKRALQGGGSSYPLANILAAANAEKAAAAAAAAAASNGAAGGREGNEIKRSRHVAQRTIEDGGDGADEEEVDVPNDPADTLWDVDLSLPATLRPPIRSATSTNKQKSVADRIAVRASPAHSLPRQAWQRILDRAQRGVGDASYESDEEVAANDEARDERPRAELARILSTIRQVRTNRGELRNVERESHVQTTTTSRDDKQQQRALQSSVTATAADTVDAELAEIL